MKINKRAYGLAIFPAVGIMTLMGTPATFASECSMLSPCVVNSVPAVSSLTNSVTSTQVKVTAPAVNSVTKPITETVDKVTAPAVSVVENAVSPIVQVPPVLQEPVTIIPAKPAAAVKEPASSVAPAAVKADGANTENVTPENTMSASGTVSEQSHKSSATVSDGTTALDPNVLDRQPAAVHSAQDSTTKINNAGSFGFGHLNPVDDPVGFTSLVFAYIIVLGSAIGFAIKRSAFLNFR